MEENASLITNKYFSGSFQLQKGKKSVFEGKIMSFHSSNIFQEDFCFFFGTIKSHLCVYYTKRENFFWFFLENYVESWFRVVLRSELNTEKREDSPTKINVTWSVYKTSLVHKYSLWVGKIFSLLPNRIYTVLWGQRKRKLLLFPFKLNR